MRSMAGERTPSVLLTADTVGGVWTYALDLSRALGQAGWQVHLATMGAPVSPIQRAQLRDAAPGATLHDGGHKLEWMPDPWDDVDRAGLWLLELERELRPDVVHLNQFAFGALPFAAPTLLVAHSCVLSWWRAVHGCAAPAEWDTYRQRVASGLRGASLVAAPTAAMLRSLPSNYDFDTPTAVLPNGRDEALFAPADKQDRVFTAGRFWDLAKNLAVLDEVAAAVPWPVRAAGSCEGPGGSVVAPRAVQALGLLTPREIAREMAEATIYALPARYEPFGLSVLEAAHSGCALVLGDIASLRELWDGAALFVAPGDAVALRRALQQLIEQPTERQRLAALARQRARRYSLAGMRDAVLGAYRSLLHLEEPACA